MEGFSITVFKLTLGWLRNVFRLVWEGVSNPGKGGFFAWVSDHWKVIFIVLCVLGAALDLTVYLFRWRPLQVWKSYFRHRKARKNGNMVPPPAAYENEDGTGNYRHRFASSKDDEINNDYAYQGSPQTNAGYAGNSYSEEDDLARWREPDVIPKTMPENMTYAGRSVPMDSPYRRPVPERSTEGEESLTQQNLEKISSRRRRRRSVSEIFGNTGEESPLYEPPRPVINSREAYHAPVYPRNWNENGDGR